MTVYHNPKLQNFNDGRVFVNYAGMLLCTCDGTIADEKYILEMFADTYRKNGKHFRGKIVKKSAVVWEVIEFHLAVERPN